MSLVAAGTQVPEFSLKDEQGGDVTAADLKGQLYALIFYPFAFSPVCTDQLQILEQNFDRFEALGVKLYGVSCDSSWSQIAFKQELAVTIPQLSDFEPKGEACRAFGVYHPGGFPQRAIVVVDAESTVRWSYQADSPGDLPDVEDLITALEQIQ